MNRGGGGSAAGACCCCCVATELGHLARKVGAVYVDGDASEPLEAAARATVRVLSIKATANDAKERTAASRLVFSS